MVCAVSALVFSIQGIASECSDFLNLKKKEKKLSYWHGTKCLLFTKLRNDWQVISDLPDSLRAKLGCGNKPLLGLKIWGYNRTCFVSMQ